MPFADSFQNTSLQPTHLQEANQNDPGLFAPISDEGGFRSHSHISLSEEGAGAPIPGVKGTPTLPSRVCLGQSGALRQTKKEDILP
eukprot:scaffold1680_cov79-Cylindrotheca_fusiformis.AAC.6